MHCTVCVGQNNCVATYRPYGCRTCFRVLNELSLARNFTDGRTVCQAQGNNDPRDLLVFNNEEQMNLLHTYLKLWNITDRLWVGMRYDDTAMLVDINGNEVDAIALGIKFDEGTVAATAGLCVSAMLSNDKSKVLFYRQQCSVEQGFICVISSIGQCVHVCVCVHACVLSISRITNISPLIVINLQCQLHIPAQYIKVLGN